MVIKYKTETSVLSVETKKKDFIVYLIIVKIVCVTKSHLYL